MQQALRPSALVPLGFVVENATYDGAITVITVRRGTRTGSCPGCGTISERIHSRYHRRVTDLPLAGRPVCRAGKPQMTFRREVHIWLTAWSARTEELYDQPQRGTYDLLARAFSSKREPTLTPSARPNRQGAPTRSISPSE